MQGGGSFERFSSFEVSGSSGGIYNYYCMENAGFQKCSPHPSSPGASQEGHLLPSR